MNQKYLSAAGRRLELEALKGTVVAPAGGYTKYTSLPSALWHFMHDCGGEEAEFAGLDQIDRELLTMARVRPEGRRWKEFLGDDQRPRFNSRTLSRHLKGLVGRGFMRREEVEVKRERHALYRALPLNERRALERFDWARRGDPGCHPEGAAESRPLR